MKKILIVISFLAMLAIVASCSKGNSLTGGVVANEPVLQKVETPAAPPVEIEDSEIESEVNEIKITDKGFDPVRIKVAVGDTVRWTNVRESTRVQKAFILGTRNCLEIRSETLLPEDSFEWTFDEVETCQIVEGITVNQIGTIVVE